MADRDALEPLRSEAQPVFATTHWSVVLTTADLALSRSTQALEQFSQPMFWGTPKPIDTGTGDAFNRRDLPNDDETPAGL